MTHLRYVVDPDDDNRAIDENGRLLGALRWLPAMPGGDAPTLADLMTGPILGYVANEDFRLESEDE